MCMTLQIQYSMLQHGTCPLPPQADHGWDRVQPMKLTRSVTFLLLPNHSTLGDMLLSPAKDSQLRSQKVLPGDDLEVGKV